MNIDFTLDNQDEYSHEVEENWEILEAGTTDIRLNPEAYFLPPAAIWPLSLLYPRLRQS